MLEHVGRKPDLFSRKYSWRGDLPLMEGETWARKRSSTCDSLEAWTSAKSWQDYVSLLSLLGSNLLSTRLLDQVVQQTGVCYEWARFLVHRTRIAHLDSNHLGADAPVWKYRSFARVLHASISFEPSRRRCCGPHFLSHSHPPLDKTWMPILRSSSR